MTASPPGQEPPLLPCPLCHGPVELRHSHVVGEGSYILHVGAYNCPINEISDFNIEGDLVELWNRRAAPSEERAELVKRLENAFGRWHTIDEMQLLSDLHKHLRADTAASPSEPGVEEVKRVARAICAEIGRDPDGTEGGPMASGIWLDEGEPNWTAWTDIARAALSAMTGRVVEALSKRRGVGVEEVDGGNHRVFIDFEHHADAEDCGTEILMLPCKGLHDGR